MRLVHRVLVSGSKGHVPVLPQNQVAPSILDVAFPPVVGFSAVGFHHQGAFNDHVHPPDVRDRDLQLDM